MKSILQITLIIILFSTIACEKKECKSLMFGIPVDNTGIDNVKCQPVCDCEGIQSKEFTEEDLLLMKVYTNTNSHDEILTNPYGNSITKNTDGVCAVVIEDKAAKLYHLETFESKEKAEQAGAIVTHVDACGACSTMKDLTVYAEYLDLGADVRNCAILNLTKPLDSLMVCIEKIGFTKPCAQIWAYNTKNTQAECYDICIAQETYNNEDGTLSDCLQCDETKSGPVFKAVAGRTRRNTGIANAICRFCEEVEIIDHNYDL